MYLRYILNSVCFSFRPADLKAKRIFLDEVLVVGDVMEVGVVDKEVQNTVLVEDTKHRAAPIGHRVFIGGIF